MKKNVLLTTLGFVFLAVLFSAASRGVAATQGVDRTGAPGSAAGCNSCHGGGNFHTSVSLQMLEGTEPVSAYEPGKTYTFTVTVNASNNPAGYGFQTVGIVAADNSNAGSFGTAPAGTAIRTLNDRQYFEHSQRNTTNTWSIDWTAPAAGRGEVRFYAAANAVNGDGDISGDSPVRLGTPLSLTENLASGLAAVEQLDLQLKIFPNPVRNQLNLQINGSENGRFQLHLLNVAGQIVQSAQIDVINGRANREFSLRELPAGQYFLHLSDGQRVRTGIFLKE